MRGERSRRPLAEVLTREQAESCVTVEFNPIRCGFHGADAPPLVTRDILNTGVKPASLLRRVRDNFENMGGVVMEHAALNGIAVHPDGAWLDVSPAAAAAAEDRVRVPPRTVAAALVVQRRRSTPGCRRTAAARRR